MDEAVILNCYIEKILFGIVFLISANCLFGQAPDSLGFIAKFQYKNNLRIEDGKLAITPLLANVAHHFKNEVIKTN